MSRKRRQNFQTIAWFWDLSKRKIIEMNPPYQRRSVWNQSWKDYFIDTILLGYPAPAIFLYEEIKPDGNMEYYVVDGKQRLTTIFEFIENQFPVPDTAIRTELWGKTFSELDDTIKTEFWAYQFSVEYLPTTEENIINDIFDRINRNVARLRPQELRHAKFDGDFIKTSETLTEWIYETLPSSFPNITPASRRQMKDVELVSQLILFIEEGPKGYSQDELDSAYSVRDIDWTNKNKAENHFRTTIKFIKQIAEYDNNYITKTRIKNQADFYAFFGAISDLKKEKALNENAEAYAKRLIKFAEDVDKYRQEEPKAKSKKAIYDIATAYYETTKYAANRTKSRNNRVVIMKDVLLDKLKPAK